MSLSDLVSHATNKERFHTVEQYIDFCARYLEYVDTGLQAQVEGDIAQVAADDVIPLDTSATTG